MSLIQICKSQVLDRMIGYSRQAVEMTRKIAGGSFCALVVGDETLRVLNSVTRNYDLLDSGVSVIESINKLRQPLPDLDAIYFLRPSKEAVTWVANDFKNDKKPQYRSIHIFWSTTIDEFKDRYVEFASAPFLNRLQSMVDFNMSFVAFDSRTFHLDCPYALPRLFRPGVNFASERPYIARLAAKLATLCLTLGDKPLIRFLNEGPNLELNRILAEEVEKYFGRVNPDNVTTGKSELVILDRSIDVCSLIVHEYSYQALAYDILKIPTCCTAEERKKLASEGRYENTYRYLDDNKEVQTVILSEHDDIFVKYRHQHIAFVIKAVVEDLRKFSEDNATAQYAATRGKHVSEKELAAAIRSIPQYKEMVTKFWAHVTMSENCYTALSQCGVIKAASLEQDLATGVDKNGKLVQAKDCLSELGRVVSERSGVIAPEKARLLLLYFCQMEGVQPEDRKKMLAAAGLSVNMMNIIQNFLALNFWPAQPNADAASVMRHSHRIHSDAEKTRSFQRKAKSAEYDLSRFEPAMKDLMESSATKRLSRGRFPFLYEEGRGGGMHEFGMDDFGGANRGVRAAQFDWDWSAGSKGGYGDPSSTAAVPISAAAGGGSNDPFSGQTESHMPPLNNQQRVIFFVTGGITLAESRCAFDISRQSNLDIYLGGTSILTPSNLFDLLQKPFEEYHVQTGDEMGP